MKRTKETVYVHRTKGIQIKLKVDGSVHIKTGDTGFRPARASFEQTMAHFKSSLRDYGLAQCVS